MIINFAIKDFLNERFSANLSPLTIKNYKRILLSFQEYCKTNEEIVELEKVERSTIRGFLNYCLKDSGNGPQTINLKLRVLKVFFNYVNSEGLSTVKDDLFKNIRYAKVEGRIETFTDDHLKQIIRHFEKESRTNPFHAYRNRTMVLTMISSGLRRGELCNLRWSDVDFKNQMISVFGKKRKVVSIPIANKLCEELKSYYIYVNSYFDGNTSPFVFSRSDKKQLTPDTVGSVFKRLNKVLNLEGVRLSSHTFRHTFASRAIINGMDAITLQRILRHESTQMTEKYVNMWGVDLRNKNEKYNPLNDLDL